MGCFYSATKIRFSLKFNNLITNSLSWLLSNANSRKRERLRLLKLWAYKNLTFRCPDRLAAGFGRLVSGRRC